jgi:amino acid transporter
MATHSEDDGPVDREPEDDTGLALREIVRGSRAGNQYIRITRHPGFHRLRPGIIATDPEYVEPQTLAGRILTGLSRLVLGQPIASSAELQERVGVGRGLPIFASDNISSSAYATEEIMRILVLAGVTALALTMEITLAIVGVLAIVIISYLQVIRAYPGGGGSYAVARENLGPIPGLVAAAALLSDYVLTVAVSVSAGVAAIVSAFPELAENRVVIALSVIVFITLINLRGVRESGRVFALPTYAYLLFVLGLLGFGFFRLSTGTLPEYTPPPGWEAAHATQSLTLLLLLRAFASGAVALTGTEAVSNGVPAFREPSVVNARVTLVLMGTFFGTIFIGFSLLASQLGVVPDPDEVETINSLVSRALVGEGAYFYGVQFSTALLLVLAGNTAYNGFPLLASVLALDGNLPRQFSYRGDRLAFTGGIVLLATIAGLLVWAFEASVTSLIPLYTVGVFVAFTLSQAGLVRHWWRLRSETSYWRVRLAINSIGAFVTGAVAVIEIVSKFMLGAWMILILIPLLIWMMWHINRHYRNLAEIDREVAEFPLSPQSAVSRAVVPIGDLSLAARQAIAYALTLAPADRVTAVHITDEPEKEERIRRQWDTLECGGNLVVIESPYRSLLGPLLAYIHAVREVHPKETITVVLPEYVPKHWWQYLLHNQTAFRIRTTLRSQRGVVVATVPYHLQD